MLPVAHKTCCRYAVVSPASIEKKKRKRKDIPES